MICAWIETSSAETGSSHTMNFGLEREGARDADALALAARELVRVAVHVARGEARPARAARATRSSTLGAVRASPWIRAPRRRSSPTVMRGLSDEYGSWKMICMRRRSARSSSPRQREARRAPSKSTRAGGRLDQPQDRAPGGRLAAARLADEPERLARGATSKLDAVDGLHAAPTARRRRRLRPGSTCVRSRTSSSSGASPAHVAGPSRRGALIGATAAQAAPRRSVAAARMRRASGGLAPRRSASLRVAGSAGGSGSPREARAGRAPCRGSSRSRVLRCAAQSGSALEAGRVYGCRGSLEERLDGARTRRPSPGVHHGDVVGHLGDDAEVVRDEQDRHPELVPGARA